MTARSRRALKRRLPLVMVVAGLALIAGAGSDRYLDPAHRAALFSLALLTAYAVGQLVAGSERRRT